MRRVDERASADIDADVAEPVEEDEVAGLDLAADRREQRAARRQLTFDRRPVRSALADESRSLRVRVLQTNLPRLHLVFEVDDLREDVAVLRGDPVRGIEAVDEVVEAGRPE